MELSTREREHLLRLAHDLGQDAACPNAHSQSEIEQRGRETHARLLAWLETDEAGRLFVHNFFRGWRFAQTDSREWEERKIGG